MHAFWSHRVAEPMSSPVTKRARIEPPGLESSSQGDNKILELFANTQRKSDLLEKDILLAIVGYVKHNDPYAYIEKSRYNLLYKLVQGGKLDREMNYESDDVYGLMSQTKQLFGKFRTVVSGIVLTDKGSDVLNKVLEIVGPREDFCLSHGHQLRRERSKTNLEMAKLQAQLESVKKEHAAEKQVLVAKHNTEIETAKAENANLKVANERLRQVIDDTRASCSVCYTEFKFEDALVWRSCSHVFCKTCATTCYEASKTCPKCRRASKYKPFKIFV